MVVTALHWIKMNFTHQYNLVTFKINIFFRAEPHLHPHLSRICSQQEDKTLNESDRSYCKLPNKEFACLDKMCNKKKEKCVSIALTQTELTEAGRNNM